MDYELLPCEVDSKRFSISNTIYDMNVNGSKAVEEFRKRKDIEILHEKIIDYGNHYDILMMYRKKF